MIDHFETFFDMMGSDALKKRDTDHPADHFLLDMANNEKKFKENSLPQNKKFVRWKRKKTKKARQ